MGDRIDVELLFFSLGRNISLRLKRCLGVIEVLVGERIHTQRFLQSPPRFVSVEVVREIFWLVEY